MGLWDFGTFGLLVLFCKINGFKRMDSLLQYVHRRYPLKVFLFIFRRYLHGIMFQMSVSNMLIKIGHQEFWIVFKTYPSIT